MSFLEKVKEGLKKVGEEAGESAEIARLKVEIANLRRKMDDEAKKAGYKIYEKFKKETPEDPYLKELFKEMMKIEEEINKRELRIKELKEELPPPPPPPPS
ncbi:MAG: hypothetical protein DRJ34_01475 [Thermoprotei archaeon]|nr:MAG: hypothetical protein DRJ34_01475 [Thermoprotei archaeon]RLE72461.1 MAG: hypothetical protein DRJ45_01790 [Thermoprotei archaeon]